MRNIKIIIGLIGGFIISTTIIESVREYIPNKEVIVGFYYGAGFGIMYGLYMLNNKSREEIK